MADLLEFMLGKKDKKKKAVKSDTERDNLSIYMPVGVYDASQDTDLKIDEPVKNQNQGYTDYSFEDGSEGAKSSKNDYVEGFDNVLESRRGDFNPYDVDRLKADDQLIELKRIISDLEDKVKMLESKITSLTNENSSLAVDKSRYIHISKTYRGMIEQLVKILPYYEEVQFTGIGEPEQWKDKQLVEIFITAVEHLQLDICSKDEKIIELQNTIKNQMSIPKSNANSENESLDNSMINQDIMTMNPNLDDNDNFPDPNDLGNLNDMIDAGIGEMDFATSLASNEVVYNTSESVMRYVEKISKDNLAKTIIEAIGSTGLARIIDLKELELIKESFKTGTGGFNQGAFSKSMKSLSDMEIVDIESINTGRKGGQENIHSLSELGCDIYKSIFRANPVESEKEVVRRQHTSLEHGYFIKAVAKELEGKGYEVLTSHEDCIRKPLIAKNPGDDKLRVEADLIAIKDGKEYPIECEMGTTSDSDMNKKIEKLMLVNSVVSFIMNNQESMSATAQKVDRWLTKQPKESLKGYMFRFTTIDALKKKEIWQNKGPF